MDPRRRLNGRLLILAVAGVLLAGCGTLRGLGVSSGEPERAAAASPAPARVSRPPRPAFTAMAPIPNPPEAVPRAERVDRAAVRSSAPPSRAPAAEARKAALPHPPQRSAVGRSAIAAANLRARETSRADAFVGGVQVFTYDPGRVYEIWTAPLRVTTLTLAPGETIVSKAAGDTVRWQIGETTSGEGPTQRAHVMIKPLERGLETNLVLATSQRVYFVQLKSGPPESFNAAVAWDLGAVLPASTPAADLGAPPGPDPLVTPAGPLDARFRIEPRGRRPAWTPTTVMTDGVRTFLSFPPELASREAPALFVVGPGGETQLVNYRQQGGLWVVDRVFDQAELRAGDRRRQVVRIVRQGGR